jgi:hypothetical protein
MQLPGAHSFARPLAPLCAVRPAEHHGEHDDAADEAPARMRRRRTEQAVRMIPISAAPAALSDPLGIKGIRVLSAQALTLGAQSGYEVVAEARARTRRTVTTVTLGAPPQPARSRHGEFPRRGLPGPDAVAHVAQVREHGGPTAARRNADDAQEAGRAELQPLAPRARTARVSSATDSSSPRRPGAAAMQ